MGRPDFVLVPVGRQTRRIAVFTDGFEHHAQPTETRARIEDDIAKRRSILAASDALPPNERHWVWSFTWTDIATALGDGNTAVDPLLRDVEAKTFAMLADKMVAKLPGARPPARELGAAESFALLTRWLADPDEAAMQRTAIALGLAALDFKRQVRLAAAEALRDALAAGVNRPTQTSLTADPKGNTVTAFLERPFVSLLLLAPTDDIRRNDFGKLRAQLRLYDLHDDRRHDNFEPSWRAFLQAWNLLQFHDVEVTSSERLLATGEEPPEPAIITAAPTREANATRLRGDLAALLDDFRECEPLLWQLSARDLPAPVEPEDYPVIGGVERDVDLQWPEFKIALRAGLHDYERRHFTEGGWLAFNPDTDDPAAIADAVAERSKQG